MKNLILFTLALFLMSCELGRDRVITELTKPPEEMEKDFVKPWNYDAANNDFGIVTDLGNGYLRGSDIGIEEIATLFGVDKDILSICSYTGANLHAKFQSRIIDWNNSTPELGIYVRKNLLNGQNIGDFLGYDDEATPFLSFFGTYNDYTTELGVRDYEIPVTLHFGNGDQIVIENYPEWPIFVSPATPLSQILLRVKEGASVISELRFDMDDHLDKQTTITVPGLLTSNTYTLEAFYYTRYYSVEDEYDLAGMIEGGSKSFDVTIVPLELIVELTEPAIMVLTPPYPYITEMNWTAFRDNPQARTVTIDFRVWGELFGLTEANALSIGQQTITIGGGTSGLPDDPDNRKYGTISGLVPEGYSLDLTKAGKVSFYVDDVKKGEGTVIYQP